MKVSVVVPVYNKAPWLERTLRSISAQTHRDFEALIVDDGSTDGSVAIARRFDDPRFRIIQQPNAGPGAARNRGIAESRGQVLAFLDADDEWHPEFLARNLAALEAAGPEVATVTCGHRVEPKPGSTQELWRARGIRDGLIRATPNDVPIQLVYALAYMSPCSTLIRRWALDRHGSFYSRAKCTYGEDAYLFLRVLLCEPVLFRTEPLATFHIDASDLSHNLKGPRPLEPFLEFAEEFELGIRREMKPLLRELLSIRASKTACVLAWHGRRDQAKALLRRFASTRRITQPWALLALLCTTTLAVALGGVARWALQQLRARKASRANVSASGVRSQTQAVQRLPAPGEAGAPPRIAPYTGNTGLPPASEAAARAAVARAANVLARSSAQAEGRRSEEADAFFGDPAPKPAAPDAGSTTAPPDETQSPSPSGTGVRARRPAKRE